MSWLLTLLPTLETAINRALSLDADALSRFAALQGKTIAIEVEGLELILYVIPSESGLRIYDRIDGTADATLRGGPLGLLRLVLAKDSQAVLAEGAVNLMGDAQVGQQFKQAWAAFDIDWEEHLSRIVGDVLAHGLMRQLQRTLDWLQHNQSITQQNLHDILIEESHLLAAREPVEEFVSQMDEMRTHVDRLQARMERIEQGLRDSPESGAP